MLPSILHVSDIHPQPGEDLDRLAVSIATAARPFAVNGIVASGDLGYQGKYQSLGARWLSLLAELVHVPLDRVVCVPGNHDIDTTAPHAPFHQYSKALYDLFLNSDRTTVAPVTVHTCGDWDFLLVNSAFHLDKTFGKVDCERLVDVLRDRPRKTYNVAVVHHNPIPIIESDRSTIVNSYEFLRLISEANYSVLLHGHQHMALSLRVGSGTRLVGVGSVNFPPFLHTNNQFNIIWLHQKIIRFRFHADSTSPRVHGNWDATEEPW